MIKCPQCNYRNIDDHRFCQQCGTSLTQTVCASCGYLVDLGVTHCPQCEHPTGTIWWTILTPVDFEQEQSIVDSSPTKAVSITALTESIPDNLEIDLGEEPSTEELLNTIEQLVHEQKEIEDTTDELNHPDAQVSLLQAIGPENNKKSPNSPIESVMLSFLQQNPRYRLLEGFNSPSSQNIESRSYQFNILDTQPFHISPLAVMLSQLQGATNAAEMSKPGTIATFLETQPLPFPIILEPYLALRQQFPLLLPHVHDAWQSEQQSVVLLENRTGLPTLKEVLVSGKASSDQILHWLQQTLNFAMACSPWRCLSSILQIDNLKVDQGQILCLQQLLFDPSQPGTSEQLDSAPAVQSAFWNELCHVWLELLQSLGAVHTEVFQPLLTHLQSAGDVTQAQLQQYLSELSQQLPAPAPINPPNHPQQQPASLDNEGAAPDPNLA